jgi:MFS superfamily sulfate permease-like transporter
VSKSLRFDVFRHYFRWRRDREVALAAVLAVMLFGVLDGLLVAIAFSLAMLLKSLATPHLSVLGLIGGHDYVSLERFPSAVTLPDMLVVRPEEPLFFANADPVLAQVRHQVRAHPGTRLVVLSLEESPDLDSTALEALGEFCGWLSARGCQLRVARLKERAREALLRAAIPSLPEGALEFSSVDDAVRGQRVTPGAGKSA